MRLEFTQVGNKAVADLVDGVVATERDASDLVGNAVFSNADIVVVPAERLAPEFFDLSTGLAGAVLQKFSNYRARLVIVGDFEDFGSESLRALIRESNRGSLVAFTDDRDAAIAKMAG